MLFRKICYAIIVSCVCLTPADAQVITRFELTGYHDAEKRAAIEARASAFITALNTAFLREQLPAIDSAATAKGSARLRALWRNNAQMYCPLTKVKTALLQRAGGYQIRKIPLFLNQEDREGNPMKREGVLILNEDGYIDDLVFGLDEHVYYHLLGPSEEVVDGRRKAIIVDFLENFRTAYNRKDLPFLQDVFSNDALIIVGRVVQIENSGDYATVVRASEGIELMVRTKGEYMANLGRAFAASEFINVGFDGISIVRHPSHPSIYGVTLFQDWVSSNYSDAGYLFLMIDFTDDEKPIVHVRTWQPELETAPDQVFQLNHFWIETSRPD